MLITIIRVDRLRKNTANNRPVQILSSFFPILDTAMYVSLFSVRNYEDNFEGANNKTRLAYFGTETPNKRHKLVKNIRRGMRLCAELKKTLL